MKEAPSSRQGGGGRLYEGKAPFFKGQAPFFKERRRCLG